MGSDELDAASVERIVQKAKRRGRFIRRRRQALRASMAAVVIVAAAAAVTTQLQPGTPTRVSTTSPPARTFRPATSWKPLDWDQLRLWIPPGWRKRVPPWEVQLQPRPVHCWLGQRSITYADNPPPSCGTGTGVWVSPHKKPAPIGYRKTTLNGLLVWTNDRERLPDGVPIVFDVPALGVQIDARGPKAAAVVQTLGPSALHSVLAQHYPLAVPSNWKTVTLDGLSADVPASWPVDTIGKNSSAKPIGRASCGGTPFPHPAVYLQEIGGSFQCVLITAASLLAHTTTPDDGVWLVPGSTEPDYPPTSSVELRSASYTLRADYKPASGSNTVQITMNHGGVARAAVVGLGVDPRIAEEIISSLRPARESGPIEGTR